jgi:hypothetical protein
MIIKAVFAFLERSLSPWVHSPSVLQPPALLKALMLQRPTLFRSEAENAQGTRMLGEILLIRPLSFTFLTTIAVVMAICIILFFAFGAYTLKAWWYLTEDLSRSIRSRLELC